MYSTDLIVQEKKNPNLCLCVCLPTGTQSKKSKNPVGTKIPTVHRAKQCSQLKK